MIERLVTFGLLCVSGIALALPALTREDVDKPVENIVAVRPLPEPKIEYPPPPSFQCLSRVGTDWYGNKWYSIIETCSSDKLLIEVRADSMELGLAVSVSARTPSCYLGGHPNPGYETILEDEFFLASREMQVDKLKSVVRRVSAGISNECGGPQDPEPVFTDDFDKAFIGVAERYWIDRDPTAISQQLLMMRESDR